MDTEPLDQTRSLPPLLQSSLLTEQTRTVISQHGYEGSWPSRIRVLIEPTAEMIELARQVLDDYRELNRPLAIEDTALRLGEMRAVLKAKGFGQIDTAVSIGVLCRELEHYPADILRMVNKRGGLTDKHGWRYPPITAFRGSDLPSKYRCT